MKSWLRVRKISEQGPDSRVTGIGDKWSTQSNQKLRRVSAGYFFTGFRFSIYVCSTLKCLCWNGRESIVRINYFKIYWTAAGTHSKHLLEAQVWPQHRSQKCPTRFFTISTSRSFLPPGKSRERVVYLKINFDPKYLFGSATRNGELIDQ